MKAKTKKRLLASAILSSLLVFVWATTIALRGTVGDAERAVLLFLYDQPESWRPFVIGMTLFGSTLCFAVLVPLLFILRRRIIGWEILINGMVTLILIQLAKTLVDRPRPALLLSEVHSRELFVSGLGYPSGHTALATAFSLTLLPYLPKRYRWVPVAWIGGVAFSRIYLGVHAPLDIVGGIAIGVFAVCCMRLFKEKFFRRKKSR